MAHYFAVSVSFKESGTGLPRTFERLVGRATGDYTYDDAERQALSIIGNITPPYTNGLGYPRARRRGITTKIRRVM